MPFQIARRVIVLALAASTQFHASELEGVFATIQSIPALPKGAAAGCGMEMLTDTKGIDFKPYIHDVYLSVKKSWFASMPPSVGKGQQGVNAVEFRILQDGSVPKDFLKMTSG